MISLVVLFWLFVVLFAIIGAMRGWAKELLVTFSAVLALFIISVLETYVGFYRSTIVEANGAPEFWVQSTILFLLAFFGYQTPNIRGIAGARFARERLQDILLGFILGALNGYLIVGSIWCFMDEASYPFEVITPPPEAAGRIIALLPPAWLEAPWIYFAVGVAFLFIIIVFI
jgi:hypothetical protein